MSAETDTRTECPADLLEESPDHDHSVAHVAKQDDIMAGFVYQTPIRALCGVVYIPQRPGKIDETCEECLILLDAFDLPL